LGGVLLFFGEVEGGETLPVTYENVMNGIILKAYRSITQGVKTLQKVKGTEPDS